MTFLNSVKFPALAVLLFMVVLVSCDKDPTTIGAGVIGGQPFTTNKAVYDVFAYNKKIKAVRTNKLPLYQLGVFNDAVYGKTDARILSQVRLSSINPTFGVNAQNTEDNPNSGVVTQIAENETIDSVYLYIPYLTKNVTVKDRDNDGVDNEFDVDADDPNSDSDGDGVSDSQERVNGTNPLNTDNSINQNNFAQKIDIDSIYGDRTAPYNIKVSESEYFLRDLDPNTNFQEAQEYYSDQELSPSFFEDVLYEGQQTVSNFQYLLAQEDDPETTNTDESTLKRRVAPGIRVKLENNRFQEILDMEGEPELSDHPNFSDYFRGIYMEVVPTTDQLMFLLDLTQANITIYYSYDAIDTEQNNEKVRRQKDYVLNLLTRNGNNPILGNAVNVLMDDPYPPEITNAMDAPENASRIYVKGGAGAYAEIKLFSQDANNGADIIGQVKANNWIINEANLVFYIDETVSQPYKPIRLYLYNAETDTPLYNRATEFSTSQDISLQQFLNYDGILDESGAKYTVRITDHINDIIVNDSTNAVLGLTVTSDIQQTLAASAMLTDGEERIPLISNLSPLGAALYGSDVATENADRKLKLEIFYTETD